MIDRIGVIGTGAIAEAIVDGLWATPDDAPTVFLSPRNAQTARALADRHAGVQVCSDNQSVADAASVILLAVRPDDVGEVLGELRLAADGVLVSAVAGWSIEALRERLGAEVPIVRTIPLPAARQRRGVTAVYPDHPAAHDVFDRLGGTLVADSPESFDVLSAATASMSSYLHYVHTVADWVARQGVETADDYVRSMFLGANAHLADTRTPLSDLGKAHETPGGNNEALRNDWFDDRNTEKLRQALDRIRQRVSGGTLGR